MLFRSEAGLGLVGITLIRNWAGVGWIAGTITEANRDRRKKVNGVPANFIVHYSDETNGTHAFDLSNYGLGEMNEHGRWVIVALHKL